eukprot:13993288-Ditylum_brightwellii.AAC.2
MADPKSNLPGIFSVYPDLKDIILSFSDNNTRTRTVDIVHSYIIKCINTIIENDTFFLEGRMEIVVMTKM